MSADTNRHAKILEQLNELSFALDVYSKVPAMIGVYNIKTGEYIYINDSVKQLLGYSPQEITDGGIRFVNKLIHPDDALVIADQNNKALKDANSNRRRSGTNEPVVTFEYRMCHKDGSWRWLHSDGTVFSRDDSGKVECLMNVSVDITTRREAEDTAKRALEQEVTERRKREEALAEIQSRLTDSEERYAAFIRNSNEGIWRFELEKPVPIKLPPKKQLDMMYAHAYLAEANEAMAKMYSVPTVKNLVGSRLNDLLVRDDVRNIEYLTAFIKSGYKLSGIESHEMDINGHAKVFRNSLVGVIEDGYLIRAWGTQQDITNEYHFQTEIKRSQEHLALAMEAASMGTWEWDLTTDQLTWSDSLKRIYNLPLDNEVSIKSVRRYNHPSDIAIIDSTMEQAIRSGEPYKLQYRIIHPDGSIHWVAAYGQVMKINGKSVKMIGTLRNIDDEKAREDNLRMALSAGKIATWDWDLRSDMVQRSPEYHALLGLKNGELADNLDAYVKLIHPEDRDNAVKEVRFCIDRLKEFEITYRVITPAGDIRWLTDRGRVYHSSKGKPVAVRGTCIDVTDIKNFSETMKVSEERLTLALQASKLGLWEWDIEQGNLSWSDHLKKLYGLKKSDEVDYEKYLSLVHPEDRKKMQSTIASAMKSGKSYTIEHRTVWPDGSTHWLRGQGRAYLREGKAYRMLGTTLNIDEQKETESQLKDSEVMFRQLFDSAPDAIIVSNSDGIIQKTNEAASKLLGYGASEFEGMDMASLLPKRELHHLEKLLKAKRINEQFSVILKLKMHDGSQIDSEFTIRKLPDSTYLAFVRDISDRIKQQEALREAEVKEKMLEQKALLLRQQHKQMSLINRAKDEFLSVASHHLRTPVTAVKTYLAMLRDGYVGELSSDQLEYLEQAYESNEQQLRVIDDILNVAEIDTEHVVLRREQQDIVKMTIEVIDNLSNKFDSRNHKVHFNSSKSAVTAAVDGVKFRLVLENLIGNASKYSPGNKPIYVRITDFKRTVRISVIDEGMGIKPSDVNRIFEKFARIKNETYQTETGTGLGLYWAKRIVEMHGGTITVDSQPQKGSAFTVSIPKEVQ